ncbi:MAG: glycosyltransferase [Caldithrix sp.]|nr:glycosyltransferase [Caldithrix sp.]
MQTYDVLIPVFNAQSKIGFLLRDLKRLSTPPCNIFVVDDHSSDQSVQVIQEHDVKLQRLSQNYGKGYALRVGFNRFLQESTSDYLLCMDADLQHPVTSIKKFIRRLPITFLIGNRTHDLSRMPWPRIASNLITSFIISKITGQTIKDSQCGFRLIHRSVLAEIELSENGFQLESEFILKANRIGVQTEFVDIPTIYNGHPSAINHWRDTWHFIRLITRELWRHKKI